MKRKAYALDRAQVLRQTGHIPEAVELLDSLFRKDRTNPRLWLEMALCAQIVGDYAHAVELFQTVLEVAPHRADVAYQLGLSLECVGDWAEANVAFQHSLLACQSARDFRGYSVALAGRANCAYRLGDAERGDRFDRKALAAASVDPTADGRYARALVKLRREEWAEGWAEYEARWETPTTTQTVQAWGVNRDQLPPRWDGKAPGRVLVYAEQGAGDVLQMLRYLPHIPDAILLASGVVVPFLREASPCPVVDSRTDTTLPACDWSAPILSLPHLLGISDPIPPIETPWRAISGGMRPYRVGVCWHGEARHQNDKDRSCPRSFLPDLADIPGVEAVSLQHGEPTAFTDYAESAALIRTLDAVVTVDTSVAHLAGTLGIPTIVLPPTVPDWRWPASHGDRTPWYPSVTLVRRDRSDAWDDAIRRACGLIAAWRDATLGRAA